MLEKKSFRLYYSTNTVEAEVFEYLKKHGFETNLQSCLTNFFLPHTRFEKQNYSKCKMFEISLNNLEELIKNHSEKQRKCLRALEKDIVEEFEKKVLKTSKKQKSILINFKFKKDTNAEEVWKYLQDNFTNKEIGKIVKNLAVKWYLFFARYENRSCYSYKELESTYNLWYDWVNNEIVSIKNYRKIISHQNDVKTEDNLSEFTDAAKIKEFGVSSISGF